MHHNITVVLLLRKRLQTEQEIPSLKRNLTIVCISKDFIVKASHYTLLGMDHYVN